MAGKVRIAFGVTAWLALVLGGLAAPPARAALVMSIPQTLGSTGEFDVLLTNEGAVPVDIGGFTVDLEGLGLVFADVAINPTADSYIFEAVSAVDNLGVTFSNDPFPTTVFSATDFVFSLLDPTLLAVTLAPGQTVALAQVTFFLPAGASPSSNLPVRFGPLTELVDGNLNRLPFRTFGGAVPEPTSFAMASLLALIVGAGWWRNRRTA